MGNFLNLTRDLRFNLEKEAVEYRGLFYWRREISGVWPLVNQNREIIPYIAFGNKNGLSEELILRAKVYKKKGYRIIFNLQSAPYYKENKKFIYSFFDAVMDMGSEEKSLNMNHSMMVRSMPYKNFFWETAGNLKSVDFSILTWGDDDGGCKQWEKGKKVVLQLLEKGMSGIVFNQRPIVNIESDDLKYWTDGGSLKIINTVLEEKDFFKIADRSKISIFPNENDAFPKFIIESLLSNRPIVYSNKLKFGKGVLQWSGDVAMEYNFENEDSIDKIITFQKKSEAYNSRKLWLEEFGFDRLSKLWASELNRLFGTNYKQISYLNHEKRKNDK